MANNQELEECPHCRKEFKHLPAHQWQCPEKPEETEDEDEDEDESDDLESDPEPETDKSNAGVVVDQVKPQEKDTRKNKESSSSDESSDWVELDYNSGKQVKTILETTDISNPKEAQKLIKAFKTGNEDDIPQFDEIRLKDGELR